MNDTSTQLFSEKSLALNYNRLAPDALTNSPIYQEINTRLQDRLLDSTRSFDAILNLDLHIKNNFLEDIPEVEKRYDLVTANMSLCWINDLKSFLLKSGKALVPDGLFLGSTLGIESFREFRLAFEKVGLGEQGHVIPLTDVRAIGSLMQQLKFALPVVDRDIITLTYPNFESLYADIKAHGARNLNPNRSKGLMGTNAWRKMETAYLELFQLEDGSIPLTLEIIYLHGWRPGPNQQKPLPRGSAAVNLKDVLEKNP